MMRLGLPTPDALERSVLGAARVLSRQGPGDLLGGINSSTPLFRPGRHPWAQSPEHKEK